jgi:type IV pilus assembly protein PilC
MVQIGERAGTLERVMQGLSDYYQRETQVRATMISAVTYPLLMVGLMAVVVVVLLVQVLPMFSEVLRNLGGDLSASAAARMNAGMGAGAFVLILTALVLLAVLVVALLIKTGRREAVMRTLRRLFPPLRTIEDKLSAGRFASVMAMLLGSGFPLDEAMALLPGVMGDEGARRKVEDIRTRMGPARPLRTPWRGRRSSSPFTER